jgi:hypothetical protein
MHKKDDEAIIYFTRLRHTIGLLGLALPWIIRFHCGVCGKCGCLQDSISHYYYTFGSVWFVGILWGLGLVLIFYPTPRAATVPINGCTWKICQVFKPKLDGILTTISGVLAICVTLFPTYDSSSDSCAIFHLHDSAWRATVHYCSAAGMLIIFSYISVCIFTRTNNPNWRQNKWKVRRNNVYIWCGVITFVSILAIGILTLIDTFTHICIYPKTTYWLEVSALTSFGVSWLVKGGFILTDEDEPSTVGRIGKLVTTGKLL